MLRYPFFCPLLTAQVTPAMRVEAPCTTVEITRGSLREWVWSTITPARGGPVMGHSKIIRDISAQVPQGGPKKCSRGTVKLIETFQHNL